MIFYRFFYSRWHLLNSIWNFSYIHFRLFKEKNEFNSFFKLNPESNPKSISIITPTYKIKAVFLKSFFESLLAQTNQNFELCLCNDGDNDPEVVKAINYYRNILGIRLKYVEHQSNQGISAATNSALALASGDYLLFIDADDELHSRTIEALNHYFGTNPEVEFIYTDHDLMTDWGLRYRAVRKPFLSPELFLKVNYMNHLVVVKKSVFEKLDRPFRKDYDGGQDFALCWKVIQERAIFGYIPLILYFWRMHPGSVALNPLSKPWAYNAFRKVQQDVISELTQEKVGVDQETGQFFLKRRQNTKYEVTVIFYGDRSISLENAKETIKSNNSILDFEFIDLRNINQLEETLSKKDQDSLILFLKKDFLDVTESTFIQDALAYSVFEKVACVFPFLSEKRKSGYDFQRTHFFEMTRQQEYSSYPGNVVTGPTHGLAIQKKKFDLVFEETKKDNINDWDHLGPLLGISALNLNYRNVASNGIQCLQILKPFTSHRLKLPFNPYH